MHPLAIIGAPRIVSTVDSDLQHLAPPSSKATLHDAIVDASPSPSDNLFITLTTTTLALWSMYPCHALAKAYRSPLCLASHGNNVAAGWSSDSSVICVLTKTGVALLFVIHQTLEHPSLRLAVTSVTRALHDGSDIIHNTSFFLQLCHPVHLPNEHITSCTFACNALILSTLSPLDATCGITLMFATNGTSTRCFYFRFTKETCPALPAQSTITKLIWVDPLFLLVILFSGGSLAVLKLRDEHIDIVQQAAPFQKGRIVDDYDEPDNPEGGEDARLLSDTPNLDLWTVIGFGTGPWSAVSLHRTELALFTNTGIFALLKLMDVLSHFESNNHSLVMLGSMSWRTDGSAIALTSRSHGFALLSHCGQLVLDGTGPWEKQSSNGGHVQSVFFGYSTLQLFVIPIMVPELLVYPLFRSTINPQLRQHYYVLLGMDKCLSLDTKNYIDSGQQIKLRHHWYPTLYEKLNWPIEITAVDPDSGRIVFAGRHGLVILLNSTGQWYQFHNKLHESKFTCLGMVFMNQYLLTVTQSRDGAHEIIVFNSSARLDLNRAVFRFELTSEPVYVTSHSDSLIILSSDGIVTGYGYDTDSESLYQFHCCHLPPQFINPHLIFPFDTKLLVHVDNLLFLVHPNEDTDHDNLELLFNNVDAVLGVGVVLRGSTPDIWFVSGSMCKVATHSSILFEFSIDFTVLALDDASGIAIGLTQSLENDSLTEIVEAKFELKTVLFIPHVLEYALRADNADILDEITRKYQSLKYFAHALELLMLSIWTQHLQSGDKSLLLDRCVNYLHESPLYLQVLVNCIRKSEMDHWDSLFAIVGDPLDLFEACMEKDDLHTATAFLVVLRGSSSLSVSTKAALRVLERTLQSQNIELCRELVRFIRSVAGKGATGRFYQSSEALSNSDYSINTQDQIPSSSSMESLSLERVLNSHVSRLFADQRLSSLVSFMDAIEFPLLIWLKSHSAEILPPPDRLATVQLLHSQFGIPYPNKMRLWDRQPNSRFLNGSTVPRTASRRHSVCEPATGWNTSLPRRAMSLVGGPIVHLNRELSMDQVNDARSSLARLFVMFRATGIVSWCLLVGAVLGQPADLIPVIKNQAPNPWALEADIDEEWRHLCMTLRQIPEYHEFLNLVETRLTKKSVLISK